MSAKDATDRFLKAWKRGDWDLASRYVSPSWLASHETEELEAFGDIPVKSWTIDEVQTYSPVMKDLTVSVVGPGLRQTIRLRAICERGPHDPHEEGSWGINPSSLRTG